MSESTKSSNTMKVSIAIAIVLAILGYVIGNKNFSSQTSGGDAESRIKPIAKVSIADAPAAGASDGKGKSGSEVYAASCAACHATGAAGAPKSGDKAAWGSRIAQGKDALYNSALKGKNAMPAKGGNSALSDDEVKAAVDHLVGLAK